MTSDRPGLPHSTPPLRDTKPPLLPPPAGTVDSHVHVFGAGFPLAPDRTYEPPAATLEDLERVHAALGVDRFVVVQPSVYGTDNSALLDALNRSRGRARGVVSVGPDVTDHQLDSLDRAGAVGVRVDLVHPPSGALGLEDLPRISERLAERGWHIELLADGRGLDQLLQVVPRLSVPVCLAHFAYAPARLGADSVVARRLVELLEGDGAWVKLSAPYRLGTDELSQWRGLTSLVQALVEAGPDRLVWGTDWPHTSRYGAQPNDGDLLDALVGWVSDPEAVNRILVDNPAELYRFSG